MTCETLKAAVIGSGSIAHAHLTRLAEMDNVAIAAVCDVEKALARKAAGLTGGQVFTDFNEMLDKVVCDEVFLFTPQMVREAPIAACAERKLPVFTEKPPAFDLETGRRVERIINSSRIIASVGSCFGISRSSSGLSRSSTGGPSWGFGCITPVR
ncbi:MAG: Gfo/Idh/MocA family oxidoreductase [Planctomycetota bacterium]